MLIERVGGNLLPGQVVEMVEPMAGQLVAEGKADYYMPTGAGSKGQWAKVPPPEPTAAPKKEAKPKDKKADEETVKED